MGKHNSKCISKQITFCASARCCRPAVPRSVICQSLKKKKKKKELDKNKIPPHPHNPPGAQRTVNHQASLLDCLFKACLTQSKHVQEMYSVALNICTEAFALQTLFTAGSSFAKVLIEPFIKRTIIGHDNRWHAVCVQPSCAASNLYNQQRAVGSWL